MNSDDDIPGLLDSSGSEDDLTQEDNISSDSHAAKWLNYLKKKSSRPFQERVIRSLVLGPFLFGHSNQPPKWLKFCQQVDLLDKDKMFTVDVLSDEQLRNVDLVESVSDTVLPQMFLKDALSSMLVMMDESKNWKNARDCITAAKQNKYTNTWFVNVLKRETETETDKVYMIIVFVCRQYVDHVEQYVKHKVDKAEEHEAQFSMNDSRKKEGQSFRVQWRNVMEKKIDDIKAKGNTEFQKQNFTEAIKLYSNAITFDYYNHVLYGNRAQAYLKSKQYKKALSDGKRAVVLKNDWAKGYYRYAQAFYELGMYEDGLKVNRKALEVCDRRAKDYAELDSQTIRFEEKTKELMSGKETLNVGADDSLPDLVSPSETSESDNTDSEPETVTRKKKDPAQENRNSENDDHSEKIRDLNTLVCFKFSKGSMPKDMNQVLKLYDSLRRSPPTATSELEKTLIPNDSVIDHSAEYVHTGTFQWYDKKLGRSVECNRSADFKVAFSTDSLAIDFSNLLSKLKLNFIPRSFLDAGHKLLTKAKKVFCHFHPKDTKDVVALLDHMEYGDYVADVVLPFNSDAQEKRMLCVYFAHRRLFMAVFHEQHVVSSEHITNCLVHQGDEDNIESAYDVINGALDLIRNYTKCLWSGQVSWSKETLRDTLGKWYPVGDSVTRSLICDLYGSPHTDWSFAHDWHLTTTIVVLAQGEAKGLFEDSTRITAVLRPTESGDSLEVLKKLTSYARKREGYIKFTSSRNQYGYMQVVYYEPMKVFIASWTDDQETICNHIESLLENCEDHKKQKGVQKSLVKGLDNVAKSYGSPMDNDPDEMPTLQSDEEEDPSKFQYKNLKKKDMSTKLPEKLPLKAVSSSDTAKQRDRSISRHRWDESKTDKNGTKMKLDQKENVEPEANRDTSTPPPERAVIELQERKVQLSLAIRQASEALLAGQNETALKCYSDGIDMIIKHSYEYFGKDVQDVMLIRYCLGKASVDTGKYGKIKEGINHFRAAIELCTETKFPLSYLGLGRAFSRQNRWELALPEFRRGLNIVISGGYNRDALYWPGTDTAIPETIPGELQAAFEENVAICNNPPKPDAICRYIACSEHFKIQIYLNDPDFKGYVRVKCFAQCVVEYHTECWKKFRLLGRERQGSCRDKQSDKDLLNGPCFTPDCPSKVWMIIMIGENGKPLREIAANLPEKRIFAPKKVWKEPSSSIAKISRKQEKKKIRKERRDEAKRKLMEEKEPDSMLSQIERLEQKASVRMTGLEVVGAVTGACASEPVQQNATSNVNLKKLTILKKLDSDSEEEMPIKMSKKQKKKKHLKEKKVITLGAASYEDENAPETPDTPTENKFVPPNPVISSGMDGLDGFGHAAENLGRSLNPLNPFSVPDHIKNDVAKFESTLSPQRLDKLGDPVVDETSLAKNKNIKETVFSWFAIVLSDCGPLPVDCDRIQTEIDNFPPEAQHLIQNAGGIGNFLAKSLQFMHMDGYVCMMKDAPKVQALARQRTGNEHSDKQRTRVLPPDTRSRDQFPMLGGAGKSYNHYGGNHIDILHPQYAIRTMRDNIRKETSTPDSEGTTGSDTLDNFFNGQLSQSSTDDREKTDVASAVVTDSDCSNALFMPSAYGDSKSQESNVSDSLSGASLEFSAIQNSASMYGSGDGVHINLPQDTTAYNDAAPPMTSPGLIHDIMAAKPLNSLSLADHPLLKTSGTGELMAPNNAQPITQDELRGGDVGESPNKDKNGNVNATEDYMMDKSGSYSPLPELRKKRDPLPLVSPVRRHNDLLTPGPRLTPEQATITPPRPRHSSPKPPEPEFITTGSMLPPHPEKDMPLTPLSATPMASLISMPTSVLGNADMPAWMTTNTTELSTLNFPSHLPLGSRIIPNPSEIDEQLKHEIADDVYNTMSQYSAFRDNPDLKTNIMKDIERDFTSSNKSGGLSRVSSSVEENIFDKSTQAVPDTMCKATNTEADKSEALYFHAMAERNQMQAQLQDVLDKYTQLQKNSDVSFNTVLGQLEENRVQMQAEVRSTHETMYKMKRDHQAETQKLQQQLKITKELEKSFTNELHEREAKISELSKRLSEEQNSRLQMQQILSTYQSHIEMQRVRALNAEVQVLELKRDMGNNILERALKQAEWNINTSSMEQNMFAQPPPHLLRLHSQWKETAEQIKQIRAQSTATFDEQIGKVRNGEQLSDLPVLHIPRPPAPPESMHGPQQSGMPPGHTGAANRPPGFRPPVPRMPHQTQQRNQSPQKSSLAAGRAAPASLASLASKSNLNVKTTVGNVQNGACGNTVEKQIVKLPSKDNKSKSMASAEANTVRVEHQRNSFIKLMETLSRIYPNHTKEELEICVKRLRSSHGGSLHGMGMDEIVTQVSDIILSDQRTKMFKVTNVNTTVNKRRISTPEMYDEEEDPCSICHEEMRPGTTKRLECRHYFHDSCIRKWYREKNECPICRKYAPLDDEFPALF